ncbi:unnamed protein product [Paramecium primaurelia]|uniref:Uncharacterized protein n=1 Tax=Paramecium primaurelia TaxID=5886 RepID=A0A8S1PZH0_PARPR|nr:unnamed protein product [Paramecium primaurelia]
MNKKKELATLYKQPDQYYQDTLDCYNNNGKQYSDNYPPNTYEQPQLLQQSNKYDHYQQPKVEEELYNKYKQGNSGSKQQNTGKQPVAQFNPITGVAYENAYTNQRVQESQQQQQQQDDALSQFSQLQQHKVTSMKNKTSNIFNTDIQETENININRQNSRVQNKRKELDDAQYKGYGQFYKNQIEVIPTQYREQKFINRNMIDNQIFPK